MWASLSSCSLKRHSCGCITLLPPAWQGTQLSSWSPARILCSTHPCTMCDSQQPLLCGPWLITSNALQLLWNLQVWPRPSDPGLCCPVPRHLGWTLLDVSSWLSWLSILWSCLLYMPQTCTHDADRLLQEWHDWLKWLPRSGSYRIYPFVCEELTMVRLADGDIRANEVQLIASSLLRSSSLWCFSWSHTGALSVQQWASGQCRPGPKPWEHWWLCPSSPGPALSFTRSSCTHKERS